MSSLGLTPLIQGAVANQKKVRLGGVPYAAAGGPQPYGSGPRTGTGADVSAHGGTDLSDIPGSISDFLLGLTAPLRYGDEAGAGRADLEFYGNEFFPGMKSGNPYAERQASAFTGAQQRGFWPAALFNTFAFSDIPEMLSPTWGDAMARKRAGYEAAAAGAGWSDLPNPYQPQAPQGAVDTQTLDFRIPGQAAPIAPTLPVAPPILPPPIPPQPSAFPPDPFLSDPGGTGLGANVGLSFPQDDFLPPDPQQATIDPSSMAWAEENQRRVAAGMPPLDPRTGRPVGAPPPPGPAEQQLAALAGSDLTPEEQAIVSARQGRQGYADEYGQAFANALFAMLGYGGGGGGAQDNKYTPLF